MKCKEPHTMPRRGMWRAYVKDSGISKNTVII